MSYKDRKLDLTPKYEILPEVYLWEGRKLYRIRALRTFSNVGKGEIGGFIEKEMNLGHSGNCWVYAGAKVCDNSVVSKNAKVRGHAVVREGAIVGGNCVVEDNAIVEGDATVGQKVIIAGRARVTGDAWVSRAYKIEGTAVVGDDYVAKKGVHLTGEEDISEHCRHYGEH